METNAKSEIKSLDTDTRIDTQNATADRPIDPANPTTLVPFGTTDHHPQRPGVFAPESDPAAVDLDEFICLVASPISGPFSPSVSNFVKLTGELDAVLRYEFETAAGEAV